MGLRVGVLAKNCLAAIVVGVAAVGAFAFEAPDDGVYKDRVDWGVAMDLSGGNSPQHLAYTAGLKDYIRKLNESGGVHGRKINLLVEDDRADPAVMRALYEKFVSQTPVLGMTGLGTSSGQAALMPAVRRGKLPVVAAFTTTLAALEPPTPMFYGGICSFKSMAQVGVGYFSDLLKVKAPKVAVVYLDVGSGRDYLNLAEAEVAKRGGTSKGIPVKLGAVDATAQVLEIQNMKPDFVLMHGHTPVALLMKRTMNQYGLKIPTATIAHIGVPSVYLALGAGNTDDMYFVSCFAPGGSDDSPGVKEMLATAAKYGNGAMSEDISYAAGWYAGHLVREGVRRAGTEPTRSKLVSGLNTKLSIDTGGVTSVVSYGPDNKAGNWGLRAYTYDHQAKRFKAFGTYDDYWKYLK